VADRPKRPAPRPSSNSLYERYKDALRRGHVASLRGKHEAAIGAYSEAASIAPDRALPHTAIGGILVKMGRTADATESYGRALKLAPRDEAALRGQSDLLAAAGRRVEAAELLDRLAEVLDGSGRLADASDAARRALELAESRERRRQVESYATRLNAATGDDAAARALAQVLRVLEPPVGATAAAAVVARETIEPSAEEVPAAEAVPEPAEAAPDAEPVAAAEAGPEAAAAPQLEAEPQPEAAQAELEPKVEQPIGEVAVAAAAALDGTPAAEAEPEAEPEPEPEIDPFVVGREAEEALARGDAAAARDGLLAAAAAHRRDGRSFAALDACYLALAVAPADVDLHLMLTGLYLERGWRAPAVDKLLLLGRLADLADDADARRRLCALASDELPDEPRLADLCA
jgi:tetratricopeptide (TPR) repeat protein